MLPPENRLKKVRDFNLLMAHGRWYHGSFLNMMAFDLAKLSKEYYPKKADDNFKKQLKLAFAAGLKVHKSAVKRNRVRRQMREAARLLLKSGAVKDGYYILFAAKKDILIKSYAQISEEIELLLRKGKLLKAPVSFRDDT